jgi:hypothetical protein
MLGSPLPRKCRAVRAYLPVPSTKDGGELVVQERATNLKEQVGSTLGPAHMPAFAEPASYQMADSALDSARRDPLATALPSLIVDDACGVRSEISPKIADMAQRRSCRVGVVR